MLATQLLFGKYPRQMSVRRRFIVHDAERMAKVVSAHNGYTPVFTSLYRMERHDGGYYFTNKLDKVLLDFDGKGNTDGTAKASRMLERKGIQHGVVRSGGGWHIYTITEPHRLMWPNDTLVNYHQWVSNEAGVPFGDGGIDPVVGKNIAQCVRLPGTWNTAKQAWCGYIPWEDWVKLRDDPSFDYRIGRKANVSKWLGPGKPFDLRVFDKARPSHLREGPAMDVPTASGAEVVLGLNCVKDFASTKSANNPKRFVMTTHLIEEGYSLEDIYAFMEATLGPKQWGHAMVEEGDSFRRAFEKDLLTPNCNWIRTKTEYPMEKCAGCPRFKP